MVKLDDSALVGLDHVSEFAIVRARAKQNPTRGNPLPKTDKNEYFIDKEDVVITEEIIELHKAIKESMRRSLEDAQKIGELLFEQKKRIKHGFFTVWVVEQLGLNARTAQNYMKLFLYKDELAKHNITSLSDAYYVLKGEATPDEIIDADESIKTSIDLQPIYPTVDIESISLPKRKATGQIRDLDLTEETVKKFEDRAYKDSLGTYLKLVIRLKPSKYQDPQLTGRLVCALYDYLKPGGKIIFHRPE
jgi:hypothetical protein